MPKTQLKSAEKAGEFKRETLEIKSAPLKE
jgi:hypothetical protein